MHLLNNALEKLRDLSSKKLPFVASKRKRTKKFANYHKQRCFAIESSLDTIIQTNTLNKIKKKLRNMKKYYPKLYYCKTSIIEEWAKNNFYSVRSEILEFDPEASSIFWV